ncbi:hypothetical protein JCM5296_006623 [Sporobolomyces johnsonii]
MAELPSKHSLVILDDYQNSSASFADWSSLPDLSVTTLNDPIPPSQLVDLLKPFTIIHAMRERTKFPRSVLEQLPNLRFITTTGLRNRAIDLVAAKELGIVVSGTGRPEGDSSAGTVEQTWALILALSRRIRQEHESVRGGRWQAGLATGLARKQLGLVGVGRLGSQVAAVGKAFGMSVVGWSPNLTTERAEQAGVKLAASLEDLLSTSDVVSLHIVLAESTKGLLGARELALLKPEAFLVNTSRGPLIDEAALLDTLRSGAIRGAGLDVFDQEPLPVDHPLRTMDNVVLSPHMGYVETPLYQLCCRTFASSSSARWGTPRPSLAGLPIDIAPEVAQAQAEGRPVVALESTLITHGLPPPHSHDLPKECEAVLRAQGVTPATIAILGGRIKVGVSEAELDRLAEKGFEARQEGGADKLWKVGRRELGAAVVKRMDGGTTVSATMAVAHLAGIKIFSTGGIGGVHRGAETSFDISSDLISLSDTPVAVVCAGSKSILDIGLTLEYLEAHAVPVAGYKTSEWPAFYTAASGFKAPMQLDSAKQVAETILMTDRLGLSSSLLLGNPIPEEYHEIGKALQMAVDQAVAESVENGMARSGKQVTPWLLQRVAELTKGASLESNKALIRNNVKVGGEVAQEYARLLKEASSSASASFVPSPSLVGRPSQPAPPPSSTVPSTPSSLNTLPPSPSLVVIGSLAVDITMHPTTSSPLQTTAPGTVSLSLGGVAGNVSAAAHSLLGSDEVLLVAPVGDDLLGSVARNGLKERGMRRDGLVEVGKEEGRTATCGILLDDKGELVGGVADMAIAREVDGDKILERLRRAKPKVTCFDGNISPETIAKVLVHCEKAGISTFFEPTSNANSLKLLTALKTSAVASVLPLAHPLVSFATPNIHELTTLFQHVAFSDDSDLYAPGTWWDHITVPADQLSLRLPPWAVAEGVAQMALRLLPVIGTLFLKSGSRGVLVVQRVSGVDTVAQWTKHTEGKKKGTVVVVSAATPSEAVVLRHYPALELDGDEVRTVTGAGDNLAGAILAAVVRGLDPAAPRDLDRIVDLAQRAAVGTLRSEQAVGDHSALRALLPCSV